MQIEQLYTGCLAEAAYYIESEGEAAIIDPLREVQPYIERAAKDKAKIKYVFETHFHADFVSGHIDLSAKTGAKIVYGPTGMKTGFDAHIATDGEIFTLGKLKIKLIHTPGHTMESSCFLLTDENGNEKALFTGDTLFIGDVGRPDLAQKVIAELTQEKLAGYLYDSLRNKIMPLNDHLIVYPGHGAGSACGKNMSKERFDTLGNQKRNNYALQSHLSKESFIHEVLSGLMPPPGYFPQNVLMNIKGYTSIDEVLKNGLRPLSVNAFDAAAKETRALIIDTRSAQTFAQGFIPGSVNIGIDGSFAVWAGTLIPDITQPLLIVADPGREEEAVTRLARVGYDNTLGYLSGGFHAWKESGKETDYIVSLSTDALQDKMDHENVALIDVRKASEYNSEHVIGAINAPLDYLTESMMKIDSNKQYAVHCAAGYRSMIFVSMLRAKGYRNLMDVKGGFTELKATKQFRISDYVCPTTML